MTVSVYLGLCVCRLSYITVFMFMSYKEGKSDHGSRTAISPQSG